jgi:hypothetical protein
MLTKWRQAIEARCKQLDVELLQAMGALGVGKTKGDKKAPPMDVVSTATQLCLPCVIERGSSLLVCQEVKLRSQKKKRVKRNKKKDNTLIEESILRVGHSCFPSTNCELILCGSR